MDVSLPKGTRDFLPIEVARRRWMFGIIEEVFRTYGYVPIETPVFENLSTLTGKYGEEGDRLLFKILNNGDYLSKSDEEAFQKKDSNKFTSSISKRGLRYDLTVPFARYVVMHRNDIHLPFKRYQIQPVWRADRPQKGRYQEFYQCDVDVVGSKSLSYEAELIQIYDQVFAALNIPVVIRINHRQLLYGIAEHAGVAEKWIDMTMAIDKLDKIGEEGVRKEMSERGFASEAQDKIFYLLRQKDLLALKNILGKGSEDTKSIEELGKVFQYLKGLVLNNKIEFDITLARGIGYYTGCIFEVNGIDADMGSLGGGGRYDNLTGVFGWPDVPGVGVSFGAERIYDVLEAKGLFPSHVQAGPKIMMAAFDEASHQYAFRCVTALRRAGISSDLYPEPGKIKKQLKYASDIGCTYVGIVGETEMQKEVVMLKNLTSGEQEELLIEDVIRLLKE
ncbi:MAG: histidine--tRNA ligase [Saprospiraceae bacterium]|uniref:Histidine--tRNA ligase n=1 Tax=Candidatus Opimibacter skivensis TaxID=2982028 RepID=A0A9D7SX24_9BACT|nr:histidine--tRNA ligase [Candidatus Opimibacter skivensis]